MKDLMAEQVKSGKWDWLSEGAIVSYGGEFNDDFEEVVRLFPAIWVTFKGSGKPKKTGFNQTEYPITFVVLVGSHSTKNEEAQRHGDADNIGTYQMLANVQKLLIGNDLSSEGIEGLAHFELGPTKTIFNAKTQGLAASVLAQEFHTEYTIIASDRDREEEATEAELRVVNVDYYFAPNDGISDEQDTVNLKEK
ncbi:phage protein Gp37 [Acinetobacter vivianii]|nr:phage protein Gp37 [Acinetobacter vivianii]